MNRREAHRALLQLARQQDGLITRANAEALRVQGHVVGRVRAGEWQRIFPGVIATQAGPVPWHVRAQAALLYAGSRAALGGHSAAFALGLSRQAPEQIEVVVPHRRRVRAQPGLVLRRRRERFAVVYGRLPRVGEETARFRADELPEVALPCMQPEEVLLDLAARVPLDTLINLMAAANRRTGVSRAGLARALQQRSRQPRRTMLREMLAEIPDGVESPLELRYHHNVERPHGLPRAVRQSRTSTVAGFALADVRYRAFRTRVELDGDLFHAGAAADRDAMRDNAAAILSDELTLRLRWKHCAVDACATAGVVAAALMRGGWAGPVEACGPQCVAPRVAADLVRRSHLPDDDPPARRRTA